MVRDEYDDCYGLWLRVLLRGLVDAARWATLDLRVEKCQSAIEENAECKKAFVWIEEKTRDFILVCSYANVDSRLVLRRWEAIKRGEVDIIKGWSHVSEGTERVGIQGRRPKLGVEIRQRISGREGFLVFGKKNRESRRSDTCHSGDDGRSS